MNQESKKQVLINFNHRCSICGVALPFEKANLVPTSPLKSSSSIDKLCICLTCLKRIKDEKWTKDDLIIYEIPFKSNEGRNKPPDLLRHKSIILLQSAMKSRTFSKKNREFLSSAVSSFLDIDIETVQIKSVDGNPLKVSLELPTLGAEKLFQSFTDQDPELQKFLLPLSFSQVERKEAEMRWFTDEELTIFRTDYRELEKEIQNFFRAYYLSGLILVAAWLIGQSKPLVELSLGNGGYNIYAPLGLALLNMVATTYLLHKSIAIHEVAQFITYLSKPDSVFNYWESWRRSAQNYSKKANILYYPMLVWLPLSISLIVLSHVYYILTSDPSDLLAKITQDQIPQLSTSSNPPKLMEYIATSDVERQNFFLNEEALQKETEAYAERARKVFFYAWGVFLLVSIAHSIPILLVLINSLKQPKKWTELSKLRGWPLLFKDLSLNPAIIDDTSRGKNEIVISTKDSDRITFELSDAQLKFLTESIKQQSDKNNK